MSAKCKYRSDTRSAIGNREGALANAAYLRGERKNPAPNTIKDSIDTVRDNCPRVRELSQFKRLRSSI